MPYMGADEAGPLTGVAGPEEGIPFAFGLGQNYPNPFNPQTSITYQIAQTGPVRLAVCDLLGRELAVLVNDEQEAGNHTAVFDATGFSSGVYFYTLTSGQKTETRRMQLLK